MRLTVEAKADLQLRATKAGVDTRINNTCISHDQIQTLVDLQDLLTQQSRDYLHLVHSAPKERVKEFGAALKHAKALAAYLYDNDQHEALEMLNQVHIKEPSPKAMAYMKSMKSDTTDTLVNTGFSVGRIKTIMPVLIDYAKGDFDY